MTSTTLLSDVVLPAATWYEKHDLSTTDMHPFVHAFTPAVDPPWQARTDFDTFHALAAPASASWRATHLGVRKDLVATALQHDTPGGEMAQPGGVAWTGEGRVRAGPGPTMPSLTVVERDYAAIGEKFAALGPLVGDSSALTTKAVTFDADQEVDELREQATASVRGGPADGRPRLDTAVKGLRTRSSPCPARPTAASPPRASTPWRSAPARRWRTWPPSTRASASRTPTPRRAPVPVITSPGVVGQRVRRPPLHGVHAQHRAPQALAHAHRTPALLPRPRLDPRAGRGDCPSTGRRWT